VSEDNPEAAGQSCEHRDGAGQEEGDASANGKRVTPLPRLPLEVDDRAASTPYGGVTLAAAFLRRVKAADVIDRFVHGPPRPIS
jgi:hypothetical protein